MTLKVITVDGHYEAEGCDYITLDIADDKKGGFSGSYGIRRGHARAVFALREGKITAQAQGKTVFSAASSGGFAAVSNNVVTVVADSTALTDK